MVAQKSEELVSGFRYYGLHNGTLVGGLGQHWEGRTLTAECHINPLLGGLSAPYFLGVAGLPGPLKQCEDHLRAGICTCGIYMHTLPHNTIESHHALIARCVGWGICYIHSHGARVQHCRIDELYVPIGEKAWTGPILDSLQTRYPGVIIRDIKDLEGVIVR